MATYASFKKDVSYRLAHKEHYKGIENTPDQQLDLLIVVDQMLTGFDSKWINTLYLDKVLVYEKLIQAFSRTNRLFGPEKPFGTIRYYRKPYTMQRNIEEAFKLYSGDKPLGLFADKLEYNLGKINDLFAVQGFRELISHLEAKTLVTEHGQLTESGFLGERFIGKAFFQRREYFDKHGKGSFRVASFCYGSMDNGNLQPAVFSFPYLFFRIHFFVREGKRRVKTGKFSAKI